MVADESGLVMVLPNDSIDTIATKIQQSGADAVQVLIPENTSALYTLGAIEELQRVANQHNIDLLLITSDDQVLQAALLCNVEALGLSGTKVMVPPSANPYSTRKLDDTQPSAETIDADDAAFVRALDEMEPHAAAPALEPSPEDAQILAALDDFSSTVNRNDRAEAALRDTDADFASELDSLDFDMDDTADEPTSTATVAAPRQRVRAEDIELTADEVRRASATPTYGDAAVPRSQRRRAAAMTPPLGSRTYNDFDETEPEATPRRWLMYVIGAILLVLLLVIGGLLFFGQRTPVAVALPARSGGVETIEAQPIPLVAASAESTESAVAADSLSQDVNFVAQGTVQESTIAPATTATGTISVFSLNVQPLNIPTGTEFVAVKSDGQEVRFFINEDATAPAATTTDNGAQIITNRGEAQLAVTARAPGSSSNVEANIIRQMIIPGQEPIDVTSGTIIVQHQPIGGGSEQEVRIVKDTDVQRVLADALRGAYEQARQQLQAQAQQNGVTLNEETIYPSPADLAEMRGFDMSVSPPVGQPVDPNNPGFTVTVQGQFSALATPPDAPLANQMQQAFAEQLRQVGALQPGDCRAPYVNDNWTWDGSRLLASGEVRPDSNQPGCEGDGLDPRVAQQIKNAIRGKSRADAAAALDQFVQQGLISAYALPEADTLPSRAAQIDLQVQATN